MFGLSCQPGSGTGMPQSMSRVIARGRMSSSRFSENLRTLGRQSVRVFSHWASASASAGRSRKKCSVSTNSGTSPLIRERGSIRSVGSSWLPQLSHWSPRALGYPQIGQVPSMYRSGNVRPVDGEIAPCVVCLIMYPFAYTVRNSSWATA